MMEIRVPATASPRVQQSAPLVGAASGFVAAACERDPSLLASLVGGDLETAAPADAVGFFDARAPAWPSGAEPDEAEVMAALRRWRTREMVRLAWRDLGGVAPVREMLMELAGFA